MEVRSEEDERGGDGTNGTSNGCEGGTPSHPHADFSHTAHPRPVHLAPHAYIMHLAREPHGH